MQCTNCKAYFSCSNNSNCWCADYPNILDINPNRQCLCPTCLKELIIQKIDTLLTSKNRKNLGLIKNFGLPDKLIEGVDYYHNEEGLFVFTEWYHLRRGYCCGNGCLHCPY